MLKIIFFAIAELMYHSCKKDNFQLCGIKKGAFPQKSPRFRSTTVLLAMLGI
jgi:hypothetical protein